MSKSLILSAEEWLDRSLDVGEDDKVIGSPEQAIIRPMTKNIIEAPEKSFKTTFMNRLMMGLSCGETVFPQLPVLRPRKVLYLHGELSPQEIKERIGAASLGLPRPLENFFAGRDIDVHLCRPGGQTAIRDLLYLIQPDDLVIDPWQSVITGFNENEFKDVSLATSFVDSLIVETGVTVYIVTHTGKDHSRGTRGHSSLAGWRDTLIKLDRTAKKELVRVTVEPRWASPVKPFNLRFENGTVVPTNLSALTPQAERIQRYLAEHGGCVSRDEIGDSLGLMPEASRKALDRAEKAGVIVLGSQAVWLPNFEANCAEALVAST